MHYDTVVCGVGLAGLTAALYSLSRGKSTAVVAQGESSLYYVSGYLDLCGNASDPMDAMNELVGANPGHPYALAGNDEKNEALEFFVNQTGDIDGYTIPGDRSNRLVPTCTGDTRYTYLLPGGGDWERLTDPGARVLAVGFADYRDFSVRLMADSLSRKGFRWTAVEIESGCPRINQTSIDLASYLDDAYPDLVEKLGVVVKDCDCLVFPAVLGFRKHPIIADKIRETYQVPVFEVPALPPSLPGLRLSRNLISRFRRLGGDLFAGYPVTSATCAGDRCLSVVVDTPGRPQVLEGENFILATGGIIGDGIAVDRDGMRETVFGLPVAVAGGVTDGRLFFRGQDYARSGIRVNVDLRPIEADGKTIYDNVFCAGRVLAGYDPFTEHDGAGVAIITGYLAARAALGRWD
jgi:glycerol-3-phosphate dehydrogenase subunit B